MPVRPIGGGGVLAEAYDYDEPVPFSRGTRVDLPGFTLLILSGTASVGPSGETLHAGDFAGQARRMLENVTALLAAEGAEWRNVLKTTIYLKEMAHYKEFARHRMAFFQEKGLAAYPASTCVQATLCREELLCEIEVLALVEQGGKGEAQPAEGGAG